ncbi:hypothetical protein [Corynebacterium provencense]|uniref:hypothetical protein n=1 Tax=Corynebacterium provencense TaxID=1737425 RepID=UPI0011CA7DC0|nr:hypothetical protein [Corynebacterium provencense]
MTDVDGIRQEVELRHCQVWWVLSGTLHISCRVSDGPGRPDQPSSGQPSSGQLRTIQLGAGRATVLDKGVRVSVRRQQGTVALGYRSRTEDPLPFDREAPVSTGTVPADWEGALIGQFAESLSYLRAGRTPRPAAVPVLHRGRHCRWTPPPGRPPGSWWRIPLRLPESRNSPPRSSCHRRRSTVDSGRTRH